MANFDIDLLERQVDELIRHCRRLQEENNSLRVRQETLMTERGELIEKNEYLSKVYYGKEILNDLESQLKKNKSLQKALADQVGANRESSMIIEADAKVQYGTVMDLVTMARDVGVRQVNMATRPP